MPDVVIQRPLAGRIRRALGHGSAGDSGLTEAAWRRMRDDLSDLLDPTGDAVLTESQKRQLIDLLSEGSPSPASRMTKKQWNTEVDGLVAEILAASG
jgi:hypothetical protein